MQEEYEIAIDWRGFELHPETPKGGADLAELFDASQLPAMLAHLKRFAADFGITDMAPTTRLPNTRRVLALAEYARDQQQLEPFRLAAMDAFWRRQQDIESDVVLSQLADEVGIDPELALAAADSPTMLERVDALHIEARNAGVRSIPTLFVGDTRIVGCQRKSVIENALVSHGVSRRPVAG